MRQALYYSSELCYLSKSFVFPQNISYQLTFFSHVPLVHLLCVASIVERTGDNHCDWKSNKITYIYSLYIIPVESGAWKVLDTKQNVVISPKIFTNSRSILTKKHTSLHREQCMVIIKYHIFIVTSIFRYRHTQMPVPRER